MTVNLFLQSFSNLSHLFSTPAFLTNQSVAKKESIFLKPFSPLLHSNLSHKPECGKESANLFSNLEAVIAREQPGLSRSLPFEPGKQIQIQIQIQIEIQIEIQIQIQIQLQTQIRIQADPFNLKV